jgi:photosystem II stability/assembly factor-like uncharacterized protein
MVPGTKYVLPRAVNDTGGVSMERSSARWFLGQSLKVCKFGALTSAVLFVASVRTAQADINVWTGNGPPGGTIVSLAIDPTKSSVLYAGTDFDGVFKSTDGGESWAAVNIGLTNPDVESLAVDPVSPQTVFAGTWGGGVFKTTNGGAFWEKSGTATMPGAVITLTIDPVTPGILFAGTDCLYTSCGASGAGQIYRSMDGGASWEVSDSGVVGRSMVAIAIDPVDPAVVYAGTQGGVYNDLKIPGGVFKTTDGGETWAPMVNGLPSPDSDFAELSSLVIDPTDHTRLYTAIGNTVFESTDSGASWGSMNESLDVRYASIFLAGGKPGRLIYKSINGGVDWGPAALADLQIHTVVVDPPSTIYAGAFAKGVFKSTDGGATWTAKLSGMTNSFVNALAVDPVSPNTVYVATDNGFYRSLDGGMTWIGPSDRPGDASSLVADPGRPGTVYAGGLKSIDGGQTWSSLGLDLEKELIFTLAIDPRDSNILYAAGSDLFKSTDGGKSWSTLGIKASVGSSFNLVQSLAVDPAHSANLFAAVGYCGVDPAFPDGCTGRTALYKSIDGGTSWTSILPNVDFVTVAATTPTTIYAGGGGLFRSTDGGTSWTSIDTGLEYGVGSLLVAPDSPTTLYAAGNGVAKSSDGGATWRLMTAGLTRSVNALAISPADPTLIYAGTYGGGVFALEQQPVCIGDCAGDGQVTIDEVLTLVNIALGNAQVSACPHSIPSGAAVNVALIIQAVDNALNGCGG